MQASDVLPLRRRALDLDRSGIDDVGLLGEHVLGQPEHDRSRAAGEREPERPRDVVRYLRRALDLPGGLRDAAEHLAIVELLPCLTAPERARDLADEQKHRGRVLLGRVHAHGRLGRSRTRASRGRLRAAR